MRASVRSVMALLSVSGFERRQTSPSNPREFPTDYSCLREIELWPISSKFDLRAKSRVPKEQP